MGLLLMSEEQVALPLFELWRRRSYIPARPGCDYVEWHRLVHLEEVVYLPRYLVTPSGVGKSFNTLVSISYFQHVTRELGVVIVSLIEHLQVTP